MSDGSQTKTQYITEVSYGVLPSTPIMKVLPVESNTLKMTRGALVDNTLRSDRMGGDVRPQMMKVDGDLKWNHRIADFDDILANMFAGSWTSNVLKAAKTQSSTAMEVGYTDIPLYTQFLGLVGSTFDISLKVNDYVKCSMTFMGKEQTALAATSAASSSTNPTSEPMDTFTGSISEGGAVSAIITSLDIKMTNNCYEKTVLFQDKRVGVGFGNIGVTGTLTAQFLSDVLFMKFFNKTSSSISFDLKDPISATKKQTWTLPKIMYTDADITIPDPNELAIKLDFNAQYDSTSGTKIMITRVVV